MWMSELSKYRGLFAEEGDFDIPPTVTVGVAFKASPSVTLVFDYQRIFYNEVKSIANSAGVPLSLLFTPGGAHKRLGSEDAIGFGWEDMDVFKFGLQWEVNKKFSMRTGVSYNTQIFDDTQNMFNILAPGIVRSHLSLGGTYRFGPNHELNLLYTRAMNWSITGQDPNLNGVPLTLNMNQHDAMISYSYKW